jgi:hypothetical protein
VNACWSTLDKRINVDFQCTWCRDVRKGLGPGIADDLKHLVGLRPT